MTPREHYSRLARAWSEIKRRRMTRRPTRQATKPRVDRAKELRGKLEG